MSKLRNVRMRQWQRHVNRVYKLVPNHKWPEPFTRLEMRDQKRGMRSFERRLVRALDRVEQEGGPQKLRRTLTWMDKFA